MIFICFKYSRRFDYYLSFFYIQKLLLWIINDQNADQTTKR